MGEREGRKVRGRRRGGEWEEREGRRKGKGRGRDEPPLSKSWIRHCEAVDDGGGMPDTAHNFKTGYRLNDFPINRDWSCLMSCARFSEPSS